MVLTNLVIRCRERICSETVLIADDDQAVSILRKLDKCRDHVRDEANFTERIHLEIGRLFDKSAITINKQNCIGHLILRPAWP